MRQERSSFKFPRLPPAPPSPFLSSVLRPPKLAVSPTPQKERRGDEKEEESSLIEDMREIERREEVDEVLKARLAVFAEDRKLARLHRFFHLWRTIALFLAQPRKLYASPPLLLLPPPSSSFSPSSLFLSPVSLLISAVLRRRGAEKKKRLPTIEISLLLPSHSPFVLSRPLNGRERGWASQGWVAALRRSALMNFWKKSNGCACRFEFPFLEFPLSPHPLLGI